MSMALLMTLLGVPLAEVITMGPGDELFTHFGHAAICIGESRSGSERELGPEARCFNYGTADFSTPVPLTYRLLRGQASFWVSVWPRQRMIEAYEREDRSVYVQTLPLSPEQLRRLMGALEDSLSKEKRFYRYHHFRDNCTTRIRDVVDVSLGGRLRSATSTVTVGRTYRDYAREGLGSSSLLLFVTDLVVGRPADEVMSEWDAMFLPRDFQRSLERFAPAREIYQRKSQLPSASIPGVFVFAAIGLALGLLTHLGRVGSIAATLAVVLMGLLIEALALLSSFRELRFNEALLVITASDVVFLSRRAWVRKYVLARFAGLGLIAAGGFTGLFVQPLTGPILLVLPTLVAQLVARASEAGKRKIGS
ncbi:MAG: DUF4105 domain-containing protein [Deltaproteobacteria bacterium]|nr:DUF4105 domain-containing protein [Deltaproteobacteria bacterium]